MSVTSFQLKVRPIAQQVMTKSLAYWGKPEQTVFFCTCLMCICHIAWNFWERKLSWISQFCGCLQKLGAWYSLAWHKQAICESFLRENHFFKPIRESFLPRKFPTIRYVCALYAMMFSSLWVCYLKAICWIAAMFSVSISEQTTIVSVLYIHQSNWSPSVCSTPPLSLPLTTSWYTDHSFENSRLWISVMVNYEYHQ